MLKAVRVDKKSELGGVVNAAPMRLRQKEILNDNRYIEISVEKEKRTARVDGLGQRFVCFLFSCIVFPCGVSPRIVEALIATLLDGDTDRLGRIGWSTFDNLGLEVNGDDITISQRGLRY